MTGTYNPVISMLKALKGLLTGLFIGTSYRWVIVTLNLQVTFGLLACRSLKKCHCCGLGFKGLGSG